MHTTSCFVWLSPRTRTRNEEDVEDSFVSINVVGGMFRREA
jgi:hypothetical protein